jgi:hypothetical protein
VRALPQLQLDHELADRPQLRDAPDVHDVRSVDAREICT